MIKGVPCFLFFFFAIMTAKSQTAKILFDASKAESAGNADWIIDADLHNIGYSNGPPVVGQGNESNAQQFPNPSQSSVDTSTAETYWKGALSSWAIDCVNQGYEVETLPYNGAITYGISSNLQDLSNYDVYIVCEPNIVFTSSEKTAIINFVQDGGGLFMISDHNESDRNGDGWDSPHIWNDLMSNNSVQQDPFGMTFNYNSFSETTVNIPSLPDDSLLHGPVGDVTEAQWSSGTSMTINTAQNPSVKGVIFKTSVSFADSIAMCAYAHYGSGKVASIGDSSPCDDGTGDTGDQLYYGYSIDADGNHRLLLMNATIWLAQPNDFGTGLSGNKQPVAKVSGYPNPATDLFTLKIPSTAESFIVTTRWYNYSGQFLPEMSRQYYSTPGGNRYTVDIGALPNGIYDCTINMHDELQTVKVFVCH